MRALLVLLFVAAAQCRLAPLLKVTPNIPGQYIVALEDGVSVRRVAGKIGAAKKLLEGAFKGIVVQADSERIEKIRGIAGIKYIEEDGLATLHESRDASNYWGLDRIDQRSNNRDNVIDITGAGTEATVYIIDTGIRYSHVEFGDRASKTFDFEGADGLDCNGHGTHCAGTAAGAGSGVASNAQIRSVRVMSCAGSGSYSDIISGIDAVIADEALNKVASMSIGGGKSSALNDAVLNAHNDGIVVVTSAGNSDNSACRYSPASAEVAITVGATDSNDNKAYYSNHGTCVDLFAPGSSIRSAAYDSDSGYSTKSGTSMACPHVAGAAAVLLGNGLSHGEIASQLTSSATSGVLDVPLNSPNLLLYLD